MKEQKQCGCKNNNFLNDPCTKQDYCKEQETCGCSHKHSFKCIIYQGDDLDNIKVYEPMDGEEVLEAINLAIKLLQERGEGAFSGKNVGDGSRVYKGYNGRDYEFRTITGSESIDVSEISDEITMSVNSDWLDDIISQISIDQNNKIESIYVKTTYENIDEYFNSLETPIIVDDKTNLFIEFNSTYEASGLYALKTGKGTYGAGETQVTMSDFVRIYKPQTPVTVLNTVVPELEPAGVALVNQSPNGEVYRVKRIISDTLEINEVDDYAVEINIPETVDVVSYYVNRNYGGQEENGSIVKPFKTWEACKAAIIGTGSAINPQNKNVKVVFQTDVLTSSNLNVNHVTYHFENTRITYAGTDGYVLDYTSPVNQIRSNIASNPSNIQVRHFNIRITGTGTITRNAGVGIIKVVGLFNESNHSQRDMVTGSVGVSLDIDGDLTLVQPEPTDLTNFTKAYVTGSSGSVYRNDSDQEIYVTQTIAPQPIVKLLDYDLPLRDIIIIGGKLTIETVNAVAIGMENARTTMINEARIEIRTNVKYVPYSTVTVAGTGNNDYLPNETLSLIEVVNEGGIIAPTTGESIIVNYWAVTNVGGINSYFKYTTNNSNPSNKFVMYMGSIEADHMRSNHFFDFDIHPNTMPQVSIIINYLKYFSKNSNPNKFVRLQNVPQVDSGFNFRITEGEITGGFADDMVHPTLQHYYLKLWHVYMNNTIVNTNMPSNPTGLPYGSIYKTPTGELKIVT